MHNALPLAVSGGLKKTDFRLTTKFSKMDKTSKTPQKQPLQQTDVSHSTLFCVTKRYPRANPDNRYEIDKRVVQLEIETGEPLSDEFFDALTNLLSAYCG